jgi:hypothetical protein
MLVHESVRRCPRCETSTPHRRRIVAVPKLLAAAALVGAGTCFVRGAPWWVLGLVLLFAAAFVLLRDHEQRYGVECERCRSKELAALRRTKPALDGTTEINL